MTAKKSDAPQKKNRALGDFGEAIAAKMMEAQGYTVTRRNYYGQHGELDLICEKEDTVVFVEVKTRKNTQSSLRYGRPATAVTAKKAAHLLETAEEYLYREKPQKRPRIDVIEVYVSEHKTPDGVVYTVDKTTHFKNAVTKDSAEKY